MSDEAVGIRRRLVAGGTALVVAAAAGLAAEEKGKGKEEDVTPGEDLMREHGVLKRVLLVYDEVGRRVGAGQPFPAAAVTDAATIIRDFIEQYHEKLEEDHLFPQFRKKGRLVDLVAVLQAQHQAGRRVTTTILDLARGGLGSDADRRRLATAMASFTRMYAPHEAREDTVLFPALHEVFTEGELEKLGDQFEGIEHKVLGKEGFEGQVEKVASIERTLGIYDLAQFTPA